MPPKVKITKEQLVDVAFSIACEEGMQGITIRKVANRLHCSIAPIYVNFKDVEELRQEVVGRAIDISKGLIAKQNSGDSFLNMGIAAVLFAKQYPRLFDELGLNNSGYYNNYEESKEFALEQMKQDSKLCQFQDSELELLLIKMQAFQAGLSLLARNQCYAAILTEQTITQMLRDTGNDIVAAMIQKGDTNNGI